MFEKKSQGDDSGPKPTSFFDGLAKFWIFGVLISLLLLIESKHFAAYPDMELFVKEFAFALLISCLFGLTIEKVQRTEFIRLVTEERDALKKDVFLYAYGSNLHEQVRAEIRSGILESPYYRKNLVIDWEFCAPEDDTHLCIKKRNSYTLVNNGSEEKDWNFKFTQIGADDLKGIADGQFVVLKVTRETGDTKVYKEADMQKELDDPGHPHMRQIGTIIRLKASESVAIFYEVMQTRKLYGEDKHSSKDAVVGITKVKLRFPAKSEFEVTVSCKTKSLHQAPDSDAPTLYSFEYQGGLLPYQGISISWSPKTVATSPTT
jgi:hypothetical protein